MNNKDRTGLKALSDEEMDKINASLRKDFANEEKRETYELKWKKMSLKEKVEKLKKRLDSIETLNTLMAGKEEKKLE